MASFDALLYMPAIPLILRSLTEAPSGRDQSSFLSGLIDRGHVAKGLQALLDRGLIVKTNQIIRLATDSKNLEKIRRLLSFYEDVHKKILVKLTFRGILNATQYRCLVHLNTFNQMMVSEGFDAAEVNRMLERDTSDGHLERLKIIYRVKRGLKHKYFPFIPFYYYPHFIIMKSNSIGHFRSKLEGAGIAPIEEDYLLGNYPREIANQAREFINTQKIYIKERVKNEAFDIWWYYRF